MMDGPTERLVEAAQERYGWTDATLIGVLIDYIDEQDSTGALAGYLAERGPEEDEEDEEEEDDGNSQ